MKNEEPGKKFFPRQFPVITANPRFIVSSDLNAGGLSFDDNAESRDRKI